MLLPSKARGLAVSDLSDELPALQALQTRSRSGKTGEIVVFFFYEKIH